MAELEAPRLRPERIDDRRIATRTCDHHQGDGLWQRLAKGACLEDGRAVELKGRVAVDRVRAQYGHALAVQRAVAVAAHIVGALDKLEFPLLHDDTLLLRRLQPHHIGGLEGLPFSKLVNP